MTFDQRLTASKPYVAGFVVGLIAAPIIAFSAGWVSTSGARAKAVEDARVDTLAGICSATAQRSASGSNIDLATLKGYENREKRGAAVTAALVDLDIPPDLTTKVANICNRTLG